MKTASIQKRNRRIYQLNKADGYSYDQIGKLEGLTAHHVGVIVRRIDAERKGAHDSR